jgi:argininosuccinate lyase
MKVLRKAFKEPLSETVSRFVSSVKDDKWIVAADLEGSLAHVAMLEKTGLVNSDQATNLRRGLTEIQTRHENGEFELQEENEDVHMNVETLLLEIIGSDAKLLHTARSRNDQVALDMRLFILEEINSLTDQIIRLQKSLVECGLQNIDAIMPGYTHMQRAQPLLFSHILHAYVAMLERDKARFIDCAERTAVSPLGAGALVGSGLPIEPEFTAEVLDLDEVFANSVDAVSDRDFIAEFLFCCSITSVHLSQLAETFVIWCSKEFGFISFSDGLTTTSSLMPQKKNPDPMELVRGRTGSMVGDLVAVLTTLKGLPAGYNRDLQETKSGAIRTSDSLNQCLKVMQLALAGLTVNSERTLSASSDPELFATDVVEYLVRKNVPFRAAHEVVAHMVQTAREKGKSLDGLTLAEYKEFAPEFEADIQSIYQPGP